MTELEILIGYIIQKCPRDLTRTELVKIVYLCEYKHVQTFGRQYSTVLFVRDQYGPNDPAIMDAIQCLVVDDLVDINTIDNYYGNQTHFHRLGSSYRPGIFMLPLRVSEIVDNTLESVHKMNCDGIIKVAYNTPPFVDIQNQESSGKQLGRVIDMSKSDFMPKKFTKEELKAARDRRNTYEDRGSNEEYEEHMKDLNQQYVYSRRRAEECLK